MATALCRGEAMPQYDLIIQRTAQHPGAITLLVGADGSHTSRDIPRPRPPMDDADGSPEAALA
ncbi:hypothetical protein ACWGBX_04535 [Streptomyces sp. NPDC055037]